MALDGEITLTIHGLDVDNGHVRAQIFLDKFKALLASLKLADKHANAERKSHDYVIVGLRDGSTHATIREKVSVKKAVPASSVQYVQSVVESIYNGDRNITRFPLDVIEGIRPYTRDVGKRFSHGEIGFAKNNVIRIDDYLEKQIARAIARASGTDVEREKYFEGIALETLDGVVKEIDARGALVRGKLVLTVGGKEIDCVFRQTDIQTLRESFDRRARIEAVAHYDGVSLLPVRLDVRRIVHVPADTDLVKWRGAIKRTGGSGGLD